jgi:hypothetical protein
MGFIDDNVCVGDLLLAMAESLVESSSTIAARDSPDRPSLESKLRPKRPPRDIFYRYQPSIHLAPCTHTHTLDIRVEYRRPPRRIRHL